ncbi:hypothetical protein PMIN01_01790 [Paraphaeosphaeria minitans]|uniref:Uncharacterized protein n=1 Tax=Paraphaeosphaeria minitans TaxID=565426 RepID=A0A9P6GPR4_9PLEO|nr:hypothetical protein PMIN01_01790 [Paraphaeosphaeria minitans]
MWSGTIQSRKSFEKHAGTPSSTR